MVVTVVIRSFSLKTITRKKIKTLQFFCTSKKDGNEFPNIFIKISGKKRMSATVLGRFHNREHEQRRFLSDARLPEEEFFHSWAVNFAYRCGF